ncbi:zinc-binding dehydrogenase [Legionella israelensis]|uniref:bi-domain-containing oxidoreductase n=1 Tax=Legionella israelensis TaxID=454 RepID=UPI00117EDF7D|nr:bi-domain-containing oxidoreductase [Legionella israelensis]QDP72370.1 zinc-binding dehydrogenase [Legionella israelensis]
MKQILQDLTKGATYLINAPSPQNSSDTILIHTQISLISSGTERMLVEFGKASYLEKARQQPEKVKQVIEKIKTDGLMSTIAAVRSKLEQPLALGYCNVGVVAEVGANIKQFKPGDRVVSNGPHADLVKIPKNLCALIPDNVDNESAAFTVIASIGLQGIRLAQPSLGEAFVVIGAGLIGLLTIQLLKAHGCRVLAIDLDDEKLKLAKEFGAETCNPSTGEDPVNAGMAFSRGHGVDGVIITASTKSNDPVKQAARMCRKRARIILVGVTGLNLERADFYEKELSFQVSCSYGPGRYEEAYENKGLDYPIGFVRWTEQRNFEAVLDMMASGLLNVKPLITHKYVFEEAPKAYQALAEDYSALGILLKYTSDDQTRTVKEIALQDSIQFDSAKAVLGVIGAGNYASRTLLPAFKTHGTQFHTLVSAGGMNGVIHGKKWGFQTASSDVEGMLTNKSINTVVIVTRHNTHAQLVMKALNAGKHVFVEKPLALSLEELAGIEAVYHTANISGNKLHLMVGFNRRFSPHIRKIKTLLHATNEPKSFIMTMNAGAIPAEHWTQDIEIGGGRIIGEACHYIDLMRFLAGFEIISVQAKCMGGHSLNQINEDKATIVLGFADGSFGTIHYLANGSPQFPKERIEIFTAGRILQLDNFRKLKGYGWPGFKRMNLWKQDKGQAECCRSFIEAIEQGNDTPIPFNEVMEVAKASINAAQQLRAQNR